MHPVSRSGRSGLVSILIALGLCIAAAAAPASGGEYDRAASPSGARLYIVTPTDGEAVTSPVTVRFGLSGMGVAPAGVRRENTGHHHLIVDSALPALDAPLPADANHIHFGGGQTETTLELTAGTHTLQLLLGDQNHVPHDPPVVSEQIRINVR